jgi:hypothetical protein
MPGDIHPSDAEPPLAELLTAALEDRAIKQAAFTAGDTKDDLLSHLGHEDLALPEIGLNDRAAIEAAELKESQAQDEVTRRKDRVDNLRPFAIALAILCCATAAVGVFLLAQTGVWPLLFGGLVAAAFVLGVSVFLVLEWPPNFLGLPLRMATAEVTGARRQQRSAKKRLRAALVEDGVKPALRQYLNSRESDRYRTTLTVVEQEGLAELTEAGYVISTRAGHELNDFLNGGSGGGSIGLAGPRGAGKSTLIREVCPTDTEPAGARFGVVVSAPVKFESRDFILHLFAEVCRKIVGPEGVRQMRRQSSFGRLGEGSWPGAGGAISIAMTIAPLAGLFLIADALISWPPFAEVAIGGALVVGGVLFGDLPRSWRMAWRTLTGIRFGPLTSPSETQSGYDEELVDTARRQLEDIWYQQTFTSGWSGTLKAGMAEGGVENHRELSRNQMTLPDLVGEFRSLLTQIADDRKVLIGIDELDKLDSPEDAYSFLNEMKVLFGSKRCYFLISVSEDAMSGFERRGLPFRDVFDSSFDDVIRVGFLTVDESIDLLQERVVGMPLPFIFLVHCVGGGLPRDVIRVARDLIAKNPGATGGWPIDKACRAIVEADARDKLTAAMVATRVMDPGADVELLRSWLLRLDGESLDGGRLMQACRSDGYALIGEIRAVRGDRSGAPQQLANELLTYLLYVATVTEHFEGLSAEEFKRAQDADIFEQLTRCRQVMSIHPRAAWERLRQFGDGLTKTFPDG